MNGKLRSRWRGRHRGFAPTHWRLTLSRLMLHSRESRRWRIAQDINYRSMHKLEILNGKERRSLVLWPVLTAIKKIAIHLVYTYINTIGGSTNPSDDVVGDKPSFISRFASSYDPVPYPNHTIDPGPRRWTHGDWGHLIYIETAMFHNCARSNGNSTWKAVLSLHCKMNRQDRWIYRILW